MLDKLKNSTKIEKILTLLAVLSLSANTMLYGKADTAELIDGYNGPTDTIPAVLDVVNEFREGGDDSKLLDGIKGIIGGEGNDEAEPEPVVPAEPAPVEPAE